jgi:hypothetical protein
LIDLTYWWRRIAAQIKNLGSDSDAAGALVPSPPQPPDMEGGILMDNQSLAYLYDEDLLLIPELVRKSDL